VKPKERPRLDSEAIPNFLELRKAEVHGTPLFSARSTGNIKYIVLFGKEDTKMYWYNPTTGASERVEAPSTDEQAIQMLAGTKDSAQFIKHYCRLRRSGTPLEQALVLVGHEVRLRQPEYRLALR
jgi:hypothetical protein